MTPSVSVRQVPAVGLVVAILTLASSTSIMSTDMYTPSLPDMVGYFDTTPVLVKLTISLNLLAYGLAQLLHGPLSDRFGRRPVLLTSLLAVCVLSLGCAAAQTIEQMIAVRILLGVAAAAEAVIALAVLKDLYSEQQQVKALALLGMVIAVAPAAAPIFGGYLHVAFGWQSNFVVVSAMALLSAVITLRWLPESSVPDRCALAIGRVLRRYASLFDNTDFMIHSLMCGVALGLIFVFITGAPFVLIEQLEVPAQHFGYYQASIVLAFFCGSWLASRLADRQELQALLQFGIGLIVTGAVALMVTILSGWLTPNTLVLCYSIMTFGMGPLFAVAPSRALRSVDGHAGTASALLSSIEQSAAALSAVAISVLHDGTTLPMVWTTAVLAVSIVLLGLLSRRQRAELSCRTDR